MKKNTLFLLMLLITSFVYSQTAKEMLEEIKGKWELDDNGNVTFVKIVEVPDLKNDEIYNRALNYFTYNYVSGKSVIQVQDKENGLIVGKGVYNDVHIGISLIATYVDAWHILRVDVKDGRVRVIITLTEYEKKIVGGNTPPSYSTMKIADEYPINEKGIQKTVMTKAFYKTYQKAMKTLEGVEKAILEGNTSKSIENSNW